MLRRAALAATATALLASTATAQQRIELPARDRTITVPARTLFRIGAVDGEEWETFARVTDLAFGPDGSLYLLDGGAHRVLVFDPAGRYVRTIGREGGGPGEFGLPTTLTVLASGELVVNDAGKGSLQVFRSDGTFLRSVAVDEALGRAVGRVRAAGEGLVTETMQLQRLMGDGARDPQRLQLPPRSVSWLSLGETAQGRRLYNAPPRQTKLAESGAGGGGAVRFRLSMTAFEPALLWTPVARGGIAAMNTVEYRVGLVDATGRPQRYLERAIAPRKVTPADRQRFLERQRSGTAGAAAGGAVIALRTTGGAGAPPPPASLRFDASNLREEDVTWGEQVPVVTGLGADAFGRLWIQRSAPDQGDGPIDLVGPDLKYLGTLAPQQLPRAFGPEGRVAYVVTDELDVQRVVVEQLSRTVSVP